MSGMKTEGLRGVRPSRRRVIFLVLFVLAAVATALAEAPKMHNSSVVNTKNYWGGTWGVPGGKYGEFTCITCHKPRAVNIMGIRNTITTPDASNWNSSGSSSLSVIALNPSTDFGNSSAHSTSDRVCEVCHSATSVHRYNQGAISHNGTVDCTGCHKHADGFQGTSGGGGTCFGCHGDISDGMSESNTTKYHHVINSTVEDYDHALRTCLRCHLKHNDFDGIGKAYNLRLNNSSALATNMEFDETEPSGGLCLSCHKDSQQKGYSPPDGTTSTHAISKADFFGSTHNYNVPSSFDDGTTFWVTCAKCHTDAMVKQYQNGTFKFGPHNSPVARGLNPMGLSPLKEFPEENFCFRCHARKANTAVTNKPTGNQDWYDVTHMSDRSELIYNSLLSKSYLHGVLNTTWSGRHKPDESQSDISNNKHVECDDCHNMHTASGPSHTIGTNLISNSINGIYGAIITFPSTNWTNTSTYSWGIATKEYQICSKCHSWANTQLSAWNNEWAIKDIALEINPNNQSYHPLESPLPTTDPGVNGSLRLTASQMGGQYWGTAGVGKTMYCSDCHGRDNPSEPQGIHGSNNEHLLKGGTYPFKTNGDYTEGNTWSLWHIQNTTGPATSHLIGKLQCLQCHPFISGSTWVNNVHGEHAVYYKSDEDGGRCIICHTARPHGARRSRMIVYKGEGQPYDFDGAGTKWGVLSQFKRAATPTSYSEAVGAQCVTVDTGPSGIADPCTSMHSGTVSGADP